MVDKLTVSRNTIVAAIKDEFVALYQTYNAGDFLEAYRMHNIVLDQIVTVKYGRNLVTGTAKSINNQGYLIIDTGDDVITIDSGEVLKVNLPETIYRG